MPLKLLVPKSTNAVIEIKDAQTKSGKPAFEITMNKEAAQHASFEEDCEWLPMTTGQQLKDREQALEAMQMEKLNSMSAKELQKIDQIGVETAKNLKKAMPFRSWKGVEVVKLVGSERLHYLKRYIADGAADPSDSD